MTICKIKCVLNKLSKIYKEVKNVREISDQVCRKYHLYGHWKLCWYDKPVIYKTSSKMARQYTTVCAQQRKEFAWREKTIQTCRNVMCCTWRYKMLCENSRNPVDCIMITRNGNINLFDFSSNTIKKELRYLDIVQAYYLLENAGYWKYFSGTVKRISENIIFENYVEFIPQGGWSDEVLIQTFQKISRSYYKYLKNTDMRYVKISEYLYSLPYANRLLELLPENCLLWIKECCPLIGMCVQHGDMGRGNVLLDKKGEVWVIDFEYAAEYPFFYDLFLFIKLEWERSGSQSLWKEINNMQSEIGRLFKKIVDCTNYTFSSRETLFLLLITNLIKASFDLKNDEGIWNEKGVEKQEKKFACYLRFIEAFS